jgi:eukaryotic-like serine/threonine-protein kinase
MDVPRKVLGHYELIRAIGSGGMGVVYEARHRTLGKRLAIKLLHCHRSEPGSDVAAARFLREGRAAAQVRHAHIVDVYDYGVEGGTPFLAMELVEGETLSRRLEREGALPLPTAVGLILPVLSAVAELHAAGIIHRDLKPANILLAGDRAGDPVPKVADFGVSRLEDGSPRLTESGVVIGTYAYMAPEQARASSAATERSDQYSLAVILYECTTGSIPFRDDGVYDLLQAIMSGPIKPPSARNRALSPAFDRVLLRAMSRDPEARFASVDELGEALLPFADGEAAARWADEFCPSTRTVAPRAPDPAGAAGVISSPPPAEVSSPVRRSLARRLARWTAAAVVVGAGAGLVAVAVHARHRTPPPVRQPLPTTVLDLPAPATDHPEALAAYNDGMHALHDGCWGLAREAFSRAVAADPQLAAAHMRLAMTSSGALGTVTQTRSEFAKAAQLRARLTARDQVLLDATEPKLLRTPTDVEELKRRLRAAIDRYPDDAELYWWLGGAQFADPASALQSFTRATEIDPRFADAWEGRGKALAWLGRVEEARAALDACQRIPTALDCVYWRFVVDAAAGDCGACEADARRRIDRDALGHWGYRYLEWTFAAELRPDEAVRAALEQAWNAWDDRSSAPADRERGHAFDEAEYSVFRGDFGHARDAAAQALSLAATDPEGTHHFETTKAFVQIALETGDRAAARDAATAYARRAQAWATTERGFAEKDTSDVPWLLHVALREGALSPGAYHGARDSWVESWRAQTVPALIWALAFAEPAETRDEAIEALSLLPEFGPLPPFFPTVPNLEAYVGKVLALAGRTQEAEIHLARATKSCFTERSTSVFSHMDAALRLAALREQAGDRTGACDQYRDVLARWGHASPTSTSANEAQRRAHALGCAF